MIPLAILATILLDVFSLIVIFLRRSALRGPRSLRDLWLLLCATGFVLGAASVSVEWHYDPETRILGFPIPGAVFELCTNGRGESFWADFVSPLTPLFLVFDFVLCLCLPQVVLAVVLLVRRRS